ncbi:relaxase/mobilization nuclease domain-containing protein [Acidovorax sp. NCPPB 3576]|uniref:relaxase/mobilization nuclease domain-containing protein n=1 Tax=Acidovorax sp. NCPPB 3576 TaxID=2940488 RepID=UPI00234A455E|nr:relaxase/mobilization nuclease domain-containing protein [Acidovorax sp. NCPPB 3576]WCM90660.1 relaxase/mobilization nuclease domain-containing protein [Acidovorax sp. NCPPB 3576]
MILGFSSHGTGPGKGPTYYISSGTKWNGERRSIAPVLLHGNSRRTERLIDSISRKHKYTSCVISFTKEEYSKELAQKVLADFLKSAFGNLESSSYDYLAYLHLDTENPHIHIVVPRVNLETGTDLNIAPPGSQKNIWNLWGIVTRDKFNLEHIEENNIDNLPISRKEKRMIDQGLLRKMSHTQLKLQIDEVIRENIANDLLQNRQEVIDFLKFNGFEIARVTDSSISIKTESRNIRLEKGIYERRTNDNENTYTENARQSAIPQRRDRSDYEAWINRIKERYNEALYRKLAYFASRYKSRSEKDKTRDERELVKTKTTSVCIDNHSSSHKSSSFDSFSNNNIKMKDNNKNDETQAQNRRRAFKFP